MSKKALRCLLSVMLIIGIVLSLSACGKSEEVKAVEAGIASLSADSTCKEINDVYVLYEALKSDDKEKVENAEVLSGYINISNGHFVLNKEMLDEIDEYYELDAKWGIGTASSLNTEITFAKAAYAYAKNWDKAGDYEYSSNDEQTDEYTYTRYGRTEIVDKYGNTSIHNFEINSYAIYDEDEGTFRLVHSAEIEK